MGTTNSPTACGSRTIDRGSRSAGNWATLRHLQITARDCVVRLVSGRENRVFPGTSSVVMAEKRRVFDAERNERPIRRDVVLAPDYGQACPGACGASDTFEVRAPALADETPVCFTVELASAHDLLLGGDNLAVFADRLRQPALRVYLNPFHGQRLWFEQADLGMLQVHANANARVGGNGRVDFLGGSSSNSHIAMHLHGFDARDVGVSTTTTGARWSIAIGAGTQEAVSPAGEGARRDRQVVPDRGRGRAGAARGSCRTRRSQAAGGGHAPRGARTSRRRPARGADAVLAARRSRLATRVGGRGRAAPGRTPARRRRARAPASGERAIHGDRVVEGGGRLVGAEGVVAFRGLVGFSCDAPGEPSVCPPGNDPRRPGRYTEWQVAKRMQAAVGPDIALDDVRLVGTRIEVEGSAPTSQAAVAAIETLVADRRLYRASVTGHGPVHAGARVPFQAQMELVCARPPTGEGICGVSESEP